MKTIYLILLFAIFNCLSCEDLLFEKEPTNDPISNFESLWQTFHERYAVFDQRGVDWEALYDIYRPQVSKNTTDDELFDIITAMLGHLDDAHVSLMAAKRPFWSGHKEFRERTMDSLFNLFVVKNNYLAGTLKVLNNQYFYGKTKENIGYLFISHLTGDPPTFLNDFLEENQESQGVIIDLRHNGGGDFTNGEVIASHFAGQKTLAFSATPKDGPGPNDYGETTEYYIEGNDLFNKPIVVLTDGYTLSAGENLLLYLRVLPHVKVVGVNTAGAMGERLEKEMPNGWIYSISGQIIRAADQQIYEGPGVPPDIYLLNTIETLNDETDLMLERAITEIEMP